MKFVEFVIGRGGGAFGEGGAEGEEVGVEGEGGEVGADDGDVHGDGACSVVVGHGGVDGWMVVSMCAKMLKTIGVYSIFIAARIVGLAKNLERIKQSGL